LVAEAQQRAGTEHAAAVIDAPGVAVKIAPVPAVAERAPLAPGFGTETNTPTVPTPPAALVAAAAAPVTAEPEAVDAATAEVRKLLNEPDTAYACPVKALFIDCMPGKGWPGEPAHALSDYMHAFERVAASSAKALDYRLIRYESKGYLALAVRVLMRGLPESIYIDSRTPGADVFESVVAPYCSLIVRGTR
jgi:hypothetical protein